jgi:hypothetical protein
MNIEMNGWHFVKRIRRTPTCLASVYEHRDGRKAEEIHQGRYNKLIGLRVRAADGKDLGLVKNLQVLVRS